MYKIQFSCNQLRVITVAIILINLIFLFGTVVINSSFLSYGPYSYHILNQFNLLNENNLGAWYSSMLLFLNVLMTMICFIKDNQKFRGKLNYINRGWLVLAVIFALMSLDELGSFHEYIGDSFFLKNAGAMALGKNTSGWTVFWILILFVSLFMLLFGILRIRRVKWAVFFFIAGLACYISNPFQEAYEIQTLLTNDRSTWKRPIFFMLLEEGSELFGSLFFLIAMTKYAMHSVEMPANYNGLITMIKGSRLPAYTLLFLVLTTLSFLIVKIIAGDVAGHDQLGIPKNWFIAVLSFTVSIYSLNTIKSVPIKNRESNAALLALSVAGMVFSIYYGSNLYAYPVSFNGTVYKEIIKVLLTIISFIPAVLFLYMRNSSNLIKVGTMVWFILISYAVFSKSIFSAEIAYVAFCSILYTLTRFTVNYKI